MFCVHCGAKIEDDALFCVNCGKRVNEVPVVENEPPIRAEKVIATAPMSEPQAVPISAPQVAPVRPAHAAPMSAPQVAPMENPAIESGKGKKEKTKKVKAVKEDKAEKANKIKENADKEKLAKEPKQKKSRGLGALWAILGIIIGLAISVAILFFGKDVEILAKGMEKLGITTISEETKEDEEIEEEIEEVKEPEVVEEEEEPEVEEVIEEVEEKVEAEEDTEVVCDKDACYIAKDTIEGDGFDTPEEVVENYISMFNSGDFDKLVQGYAVETYVDNYTLDKQIERLGSYSISNEIKLPHYSEFAREINLKNRENVISRQLMYQYMMYMGWEEEVKSKIIEKGEGSAEELIQNYLPNNEDKVFGKIEFVSYVDAPMLVKYMSGKDSWNDQKNVDNREKVRLLKNAEAVESLGVLLKTDNGYYFLATDLIKYNEKWYMDVESQLASMLGMPATDGNMYYVGEELPKGAKLLLK